MRKKIFIILGIIITLLGITAGGYAVSVINTPKHPSDYHIGITLEDAMKSNKPVVAVFYADWCGYCLRFMPKFQSYYKLYKDKFDFVMIDVEGNADRRILSEEVGITGYPTVYILDFKYDNRVLLPNSIYHDLTKFRVELERYLRIRNLLDKAVSAK